VSQLAHNRYDHLFRKPDEKVAAEAEGGFVILFLSFFLMVAVVLVVAVVSVFRVKE
jgi:hypothetical protein